jgi:hypothetical protein
MVNGRIAGFPKRGRSPTVAPLQMATELLRHNCSTVERPLAASGGEAGIRSPLTKENLHASSINLAGGDYPGWGGVFRGRNRVPYGWLIPAHGG